MGSGLFLCLFFLLYILYKYNSSPKNTLFSIKRLQAQIDYLRISVLFCLTQGFITLKTQANAICIALQCIELLCITPLHLHLYASDCHASLCYPSHCYASLFYPCNSMHKTPMHLSAIHHTPMHHSSIPKTPMHHTPTHPDRPHERPELFCECPNMPAHRFY